MRKIILVAAAAVIVTAWSPLARADLVANGSFATDDFSDWTVSDPNYPPSQSITIDSDTPYPGDSYDASLGTEGTTGSLSQTLATTPGTTYTISFELQDEGNSSSSSPEESMLVTFGGDTLFNFDSSSGTPFGILYGPGYDLFSFTDVASTASTPLSFIEENDYSDWLLDDVSVTPLVTSVPEPSSAVLILTGLAAFAARRRRPKSRPGI